MKAFDRGCEKMCRMNETARRSGPTGSGIRSTPAVGSLALPVWDTNTAATH